MPTCADCGNAVDPEKAGTWLEVQGWVRMRKGGGAHGVSLPHYLGRFMCNACMAVRRLAATKPAVHPGQMAMFDDA